MAKLDPVWEGYPVWQTTISTLAGHSPPPSCKRDQIKMREYMDWQVTPPKPVTSPTWGPPPPCKQALRNRVCSITTHLFHSETKQYMMNWFYTVYAYLSTVWKYVFLLHPDCTYLTRTKTLSMLGTGYLLKIAKKLILSEKNQCVLVAKITVKFRK